MITIQPKMKLMSQLQGYQSSIIFSGALKTLTNPMIEKCLSPSDPVRNQTLEIAGLLSM